MVVAVGHADEAEGKLRDQSQQATSDLAVREARLQELSARVSQLENEKGQLEVMLDTAKNEAERTAAMAMEAE